MSYYRCVLGSAVCTTGSENTCGIFNHHLVCCSGSWTFWSSLFGNKISKPATPKSQVTLRKKNSELHWEYLELWPDMVCGVFFSPFLVGLSFDWLLGLGVGREKFSWLGYTGGLLMVTTRWARVMLAAVQLASLERPPWRPSLSRRDTHGLLELQSQEWLLKIKLEAGCLWYNLCLTPLGQLPLVLLPVSRQYLWV